MTESGPAQPMNAEQAAIAALEAMRMRLIEKTAHELTAQGVREIALFGAGRHTRPILRQPWIRAGIRVVCILDDQPLHASMGDIPILKSDDPDMPGTLDAIIISSEHYEAQLYERAVALYGNSGVRIVRLYHSGTDRYSPKCIEERLLATGAVTREDARWLIENRGERHDATLDMLAPDRTELHLRRYELARDLLGNLGGSSVADLACGTGYGAGILADRASVTYTGVDIDARAIGYATRRHGDTNRRFCCSSATDLPLERRSVDLVASFETVEHIEDTSALVSEYARVLRADGALVISTPNRLGPTPYHVHDFDYASLTAALSPHFRIQEVIGQLPVDTVFDPALPPGMWRIDPNQSDDDAVGPEGRRPDYLILVARPLGSNAPGLLHSHDPEMTTIETRHGPIQFYCPTQTVRWRAHTLLEKEPETIDWIETFETGDVYWDIGASTGPYVMYAAAAGKVSRILAFEPSPWNWWVLAEQIRRATIGQSVTALPIAIGDQTSVGMLHMRHPMPGGAGSSFGEPLGEFGERFAASFEQGAISVTIDELVTRFSLPVPNRLKIDVDGNELAVLRGSRDTLARSELRSVLIELDDSRDDLLRAVTGIMNESGLELCAKRQAPGVDSTGNASIYNFIFDRSEG